MPLTIYLVWFKLNQIVDPLMKYSVNIFIVPLVLYQDFNFIKEVSNFWDTTYFSSTWVIKDTIAGIITSIRNADINRKGTVQIISTNITENIVKILLREGFKGH